MLLTFGYRVRGTRRYKPGITMPEEALFRDAKCMEFVDHDPHAINGLVFRLFSALIATEPDRQGCGRGCEEVPLGFVRCQR